jgi:hypothetical protein
MRVMQGVFLLSLGLLLAFGACRRNQPSLVDKNEAPDTQLWYAPPDSTEYEYLVHMYWRGHDNDGTAVQFIWTIKDTLVDGELVWNPSERLRDFREGQMTSRTDSIFSFTAFRDIGGVGVKKNRQAFHIASIDDNGVIDPSPAAIEFVATINRLPQTKFATHIAGVSEPYVPLDVPKDTVGVMHPFGVSFHGVTTNGLIREYYYYPLTTGVFVDGQNEWYEDLSDTLITFPNTSADLIPSGTFRFAAQSRDDADAESPVDAGRFQRGVCQIVVNFDPDTQIIGLRSSYTVDDQVFEQDINFTDGEPDTVSYDSYVRLRYYGEDDDRDDKIECNDLEPDKCISFQVAFQKNSVYNPAAEEFSLWQPRTIPYHDTDPFSSTDTNTFHMGSLTYDLFARALDEHERPDGTPPSVRVIGNFVPSLDSIAVEDHLGNRIDLSMLDTVTWNFWKGEGWPYVCECDTVDKPEIICGAPTDPLECQFMQFPENGSTLDYFKIFSVHIKAWGHDNPKDPTTREKDPLGSGVKAWNYRVMNDQGQFLNMGKSLAEWFAQKDGNGDAVINFLDDEIRWKVYYPGPFTQAPDEPDPMGDTVFENLPSWMGENLLVVLVARDTPPQSLFEFEQTIFINGTPLLINSFGDASLGRRTEPRDFAFRIELVR